MKKNIMLIIITFVITIVGTSYAAYKIKAEQVGFDNSNTDLNSNDVQSALDELAADILSYGDAESSDIKEGKTALVNGKKITGTATLLNKDDSFSKNIFAWDKVNSKKYITHTIEKDGKILLNYYFGVYSYGDATGTVNAYLYLNDDVINTIPISDYNSSTTISYNITKQFELIVKAGDVISVLVNFNSSISFYVSTMIYGIYI